jgi:threonine/homoserine/homoserine lactone efflux protein
MDYGQSLWLFGLLLFGIIIVPGMDMVYVLGSALSGGVRSGFAAVAGLLAGGAVHTVTGTLGVTVLTVLVPQLFLPMLLAGAAYMVWVGIGLVRSSIVVGSVAATAAPSHARTAARAFVTCMLNPKAWLFIIAVYPQFMKPHYGPILQQALVMGLMTLAMQFVVYGTVALAAGGLRTWLRDNTAATVAVGRAAGALIVLAALFTAWRGWAELAG